MLINSKIYKNTNPKQMYAEPHEKQPTEQQDFMLEQQINMFTNPLPQISRGESDIFFKEVYREEGFNISSVQIGFRVALITPEMYDFVCVLVNQIHCHSEENLKLIIDGNQLWATSTIVYSSNSFGDAGYKIIQANIKESLAKTQLILRQILKECRDRFDKSEPDEEILKIARTKFKNITKAFRDPNADY